MRAPIQHTNTYNYNTITKTTTLTYTLHSLLAISYRDFILPAAYGGHLHILKWADKIGAQTLDKEQILQFINDMSQAGRTKNKHQAIREWCAMCLGKKKDDDNNTSGNSSSNNNSSNSRKKNEDDLHDLIFKI